MLNILSLGAGVQSTTVLLMSCLGELPKLDCAIFADTGWEPLAVYEHLAWLEQEAAGHGIPVHRVSKGNLRRDALVKQERGTKQTGSRWASIPLYTKQGDGSLGMIRRQCTKEYKIEPIEAYMRTALLGLKPRQRAPKDVKIEQWFGISADESSRMKDSPLPWKRHVYPLCGMPEPLLERPYTRAMCQRWLGEHYPERHVPRSACIGCPFHSDHEWRRMKADDPVSWADAVAFDAAIRNCGGMRGQMFLHRSCVPLAAVDFSTAEERGQGSLWNNECSGGCGV